jgi:antitoxin (DNA-binding transcriptional repressor) of toxin-antitoxin stability system
MALIDSDQMYTVTEARPKLHALVARARQGQTAYIVKGSHVVAHLVPPTARIIDDERLFARMARAVLEHETRSLTAHDWRDGRFQKQGSDVLGRFFAWAWSTDKALFDELWNQLRTLLRKSVDPQIEDPAVLDLLNGPMSAIMAVGEIAAARQHVLGGGARRGHLVGDSQ